MPGSRVRCRRTVASGGLSLLLALLLADLPAGSTRSALAGAAEEQGLAIMKEQEQVNQGFKSEVVLYRMTLVNANGDRSERGMEVRRLEGGSEGDKTLIVFRAPPDIKGTGLLTAQNKTGDDDQWLYLPALRRIRRIASANRTGSFAGSEFTYEDLVPFEVGKYTYRYLRDDLVGDVPVRVVESIPRLKESGYSRTELFVGKDNQQTVRINFFDKKNEMVKVGRFEKWVKAAGKWWRAGWVQMENLQTRKATVLEIQRIEVGAGLSAADFTTRALER